MPVRARQCRPLRNAILAASSRYLTRAARFRVPIRLSSHEHEVICYDGNLLIDLTAETTLQYHSDSINDLIRLSNDPEQVHNQDLLAAAIILRLYEELDTTWFDGQPETTDNGIHGQADNELFLKVTNMFLNAQRPNTPRLPHTSSVANNQDESRSESLANMSWPVLDVNVPAQGFTRSLSESPARRHLISETDPTPRVVRSDGLRQACFWVGFRQEITVSFLKQRPIRVPLSRCSAFRSFGPAEDTVWADRLVIFCADVLQFCHGGGSFDFTDTTDKIQVQSTPPVDTFHSNGPHPGSLQSHHRQRWSELKATEATWAHVLPASLTPVYARPPDPGQNRPFPELWYLSDCQTTGIQHLELARILLAVSNPSIPRLGIGLVAAMKKLSEELRAIVRRLCGIALSHRASPTGFIAAFMAIAMCGEHFAGEGEAERREQEALMDVLRLADEQYAWPTAKTQQTLRQAWGWR